MPYKDPAEQRKAQREWAKQKRAENPEARRKQQRERRAKWSDYIRELKKQPCADCDLQWPYYVMEYHHVRGEKKYEVSYMVNQCMTISLIEEEIAKCDLLCSNCHRIRTHE